MEQIPLADFPQYKTRERLRMDTHALVHDAPVFPSSMHWQLGFQLNPQYRPNRRETEPHMVDISFIELQSSSKAGLVHKLNNSHGRIGFNGNKPIGITFGRRYQSFKGMNVQEAFGTLDGAGYAAVPLAALGLTATALAAPLMLLAGAGALTARLAATRFAQRKRDKAVFMRFAYGEPFYTETEKPYAMFRIDDQDGAVDVAGFTLQIKDFAPRLLEHIPASVGLR